MAGNSDWNAKGSWADDAAAEQEEEKEVAGARGQARGGKKAGHYVRTGATAEIKADWQQSSFGEQPAAARPPRKVHNEHYERTDEPRGPRRPRGRGRGRGRRGGRHQAGGEVHPTEEAKYHGDVENKTKETVSIKRRGGRRLVTNEHIQAEDFHSEDIPMDPTMLTTESHFRAEAEWSQMGLPQELLGLLMENGFPFPSKVQAHAIKLILENQEDHIIVQAPTGSGKTVAFILSTLTLIDRANPNAQVMLVAPTNELLDQLTTEYKSFAEPLSITVTCIKKGDKTFPGQVLLMTPAQCTGLFKIKGENKPVLDNVKFLILDEADHLLNIEDQPEFFNHMETVIKECLPPTCRCLLFSATYSDPVMAKIDEVLERGYTEVMVKKEELILENIKMFYIQKTEEQGKIDLLIKILREPVPGVTIVFSNTVRFAHTLFRVVNERGTKCALLVGKNMTADERIKTMGDFMKGFYSVLITTNILARGIDNTRVSRIINFDMPRHFSTKKVDAETYLHRIGRSGRFNRPGIAISVVATEDELAMLNDVKEYYGSTCTIEQIHTDEELQARMHTFSEEINKLEATE